MNLPAVEASLRRLQERFDGINERLGARRDALDDRVIGNMLAGYALVDTLVADGLDLFALGSSKHLLELNTVVLCGTSPARRDAYAGHMAATERRFYDQQPGGVRDLVEWQALHAGEPVWDRAAGAFLQILGQPQLFIEGNHRAGALVMSYILIRENHPPFVLTVENAGSYFALPHLIRDAEKSSAAMLLRWPAIRRGLATLLRAHTDHRHLLG